MSKGFGRESQKQGKHTYKTYLDFFHKALKIVENNSANQQVVYKFLESNRNKLDENFARFFQNWSITQLTNKPSKQAFNIAIEILNFSNLVGNFFAGDMNNNIEIAIAGYESVFKFYTKSYFSQQQWATIQHYCGNFYSLRSQGNKSENIEKAIIHYTEALEKIYLLELPILWASTQHYLGLAYRQRFRGEKSENLTKAIFHYRQALKIYSQDFLPEMWASLLENLGNAYLLRKSGNREDPELAIECFLETLKVRTYRDFPNDWAISKSNLGWAYLERIQGDKSENIEQAILFLKESLQVLIPSPQLSAQWMSSDPWAQAKSNLGDAYLRRTSGDRSENLELAINCFQEALTFYTQEFFPEQWAKFLIKLGDALFWRIRGNRVENLERAIDCFQEALKVYTQQSFPEKWADALMRLGDTLIHRIRGDWVNNFQQAIKCYQQILSVYTKEAFPYFWARTKQHLGKIHIKYILQKIIENNDRVEDSDEYIEKAIAYFQEALQVFTPETFPEEWGSVKIDLGSIYLNSLQKEEIEYTKRAIGYFQESLQVYSLQSSPLRWANAHNCLGVAYLQATLEDKAENIERGLYHFNLSLQKFVRLQDPENWAGTQCNLGHAYGERILGEKTENIERAINHHTAALEIYKYSNFQRETFLASKEIGDLAFANQMWDKAIFGYEIAVEAMEIIRTWISVENRRQKSLEGYIHIYQNMIQACINTGQIDKALEYVERSRSKRLVDLMASNDLYSGGEIPQAVKELLQQYENLQQQIDTLHSQNNSKSDRGILNTNNRTRAALELDIATISKLEAQKQEIWQQMRKLDPVLAGEIQVSAPNISQMQQLIDRPTTAILSFYTTNNDTHIFILRRDRIDLHTCIGQGVETLQNWLRQEWLIPYTEKDSQWSDRIGFTLTQLAERLQIGELIEGYLDGIEELIIVPHLLLHQIPFAAIPVESDLYLGDRFLIRHIPSCQVLEFCQQRQEIKTFTYGTVEDAEENLPCASFEGEQIAHLYDIPRKQRLQGSQEATCKNYRQLIEQVQAIHCCHHAESRLNNPLESRLKLADGSITLGQLMTPGWRLPNLCDVFLSCCETGLGEPSLSNDIFTLSTGFLCAGARTVISTLWSVNDLATALFSIFYYQQLKQAKDRSLALQQAQRQLRQLKKEDFIAIALPLQNRLQSREKELIKERKKYLPDSIERLQWNDRYKAHATTTRLINDISNNPEELPFSHPLYWAAFICQGLRK